MKNKPESSKSSKTRNTGSRKKISPTKLGGIFLILVLAISFILFSIFNPGIKKAEDKKGTTYRNANPEFKKEGNLGILRINETVHLQLDIEIADNDAERMRGLMDRFTLPEMGGMLFIFDKDEPRSFWMKNTYIPLDIIYINSEKKIVSIQKYTQPKTTFSIPSEKPAMYVLEVNAGFTDKYNINPGDRIEFSSN